MIGKRGGVTTIFVLEHFSGELLGCEDKKSYVVIVSHGISDTVFEKLPGELFEELVSLGAHLLGPPAILGLRARGEQLIVKKSPVFCLQVRLMR